MQPLTAFPLPLETGAPPAGYAPSDSSSTSAFEAGVNERDTFFGQRRCIICGKQVLVLQHCYIIPKTEEHTWEDLKYRGWLPQQAKDAPQREPRNGLLLCVHHHALFDQHLFFIRFFPNAKKFVLIDYSDHYYDDIQPYHGKAIALDIADKYAPFPSLFIFFFFFFFFFFFRFH
ncbi:hypothetical protein V8E52_010919 [Russula decolorans]